MAIIREATRLAHPFLTDDFIAGERTAIREMYLPNTVTVVAEDDGGAVIGFASMMGDELGAIFLDPAHHGTGVGLALMNVAAKGHDVVEVEVFERNPIGRAFYEKYGFQELKRSVHDATGETLIRMRWLPDADADS